MSLKLEQNSISLSILIVVSGLVMLAHLGFYNRYWADDWCYNDDFKHQGIVKAVGNYLATADDADRGYSTNRYSLTLIAGLLYLLGIFGTQILATLTIVLWVIALLWVGQNLNRFRSFTTNPILILASALLLFYTLYLSTHRFQILYWHSGVLPYSWTIISGLFILGLITSQLTRVQPSKSVIFTAAFVSFLGGGFSEIGSAFLFSGATLLLLAAWWGKRRSQEWAVKTYLTIFTAWIFLLMAIIALALSPSNIRYADLNKEPNNPFLVPFLSMRNAFGFILYSLLGLPIPHAIFLAAFISLGVLSRTTQDAPYNIGRSVQAIIWTMLITFLLVVAIQAPTTYLYTAPPDPRGQSLSRFVVLTGMAITAWIFGVTVSSNVRKGDGGMTPLLQTFLPVTLLLIGCVYTARATLNIYQELPGFIERAQLWDARDAQIKTAIAQGITQIEIIAIDTKDIDTRDIIRSEAFGKWVTDACGVKYYDAEAMRVAP
jgi:fumarate reductase subunit C